uniref:Uncharacterized protein n=1 Tax=Chenopodium quinoa TaxID=63459 RepID=A0A803MAR7_CHEQI
MLGSTCYEKKILQTFPSINSLAIEIDNEIKKVSGNSIVNPLTNNVIKSLPLRFIINFRSLFFLINNRWNDMIEDQICAAMKYEQGRPNVVLSAIIIKNYRNTLDYLHNLTKNKEAWVWLTIWRGKEKRADIEEDRGINSQSGNNLTGRIPPQLGHLSSLETMILWYNVFERKIPREFGNLTNLRYLDLAIANLGGEIQAELGGLIQLDTLYLYKNNLGNSS